MEPSDADFQKTIITPAAVGIADRILIILNPQFQELKIDDQDDEPEAVRKRLSAEVSKIVKKALILRGKMRAAPEYYEWVWAYSGMPFNANMEDLRQGNGRREVEWAVTPRIKVKETKESTVWETVTLAKVFTKKS